MTAKQIPIRYIGLRPTETDHLYRSGAVFAKGKVTLVPDWAAAKLLKHTEYEDARAKPHRGEPITAERVLDAAEIEAESLEHEALDAHANIETMTRDQMAAHAMRNYGVRIDAAASKAAVTGTVRSLMQSRGGR